jgi:hypothetical protein
VPVALICTHSFAALARATAAGLGLEHVPLVLITHPLAGTLEREVTDRANEAFDQVIRVLTGAEGAAT